MGRRKAKPSDTPAAEPQPASPRVPGRVWVVFARAHTHRDVPYSRGDRLTVTEAEAELLRQFHAIEVD